MKKFLLILLAVVLLQACGADSSQNKLEPKIDPLSVQDEYMQLVNQHRSQLGLRSLVYTKVIEAVAVDYSKVMAGRGYINHLGLGKRCSRIRNEMGQGNRCGEILASGQKNAKAVFEAWLNSPEHRRAIEDPNYTHTGFGFAENGKGKIFWSQMFLEI